MLKNTIKRGFTLLELIVVLLILGILALIAVPTYEAVQMNSLERTAMTTAQAMARDANAISASGASAGDTSAMDIATAAIETGYDVFGGDTRVAMVGGGFEFTFTSGNHTAVVSVIDGGVGAPAAASLVSIN